MQQVELSKKGKEGRQIFQHEGRTIYEWEQSLEEINVYIRPPEGVTSNIIDCTISNNRVSLGLKGNPPFLDHQTYGTVKVSDSFWMIDDGELNINLQKINKGETWPMVFQGHQPVDPVTQDEMQKNLMLERFQEENPGFDFSGATFSGSCPDPRNFMGGVKHI